MKKTWLILLSATFFVLTSSVSITAQSVEGGTIIYEQIIDYGLEEVSDNPRWTNFIADLPKSGKAIFTLDFTKEKALYQEDLNNKEPMSPELKGAVNRASKIKIPTEDLKKVFYDFSKQEKVEQIEFMTRFFVIESKLENKDWKLTTRKKKVLDYVCMGAELELGEETITAWFTPEIPISAGPGIYNGLPGLILGLEKNEEIFILATAVNLKTPAEADIAQPDKGQKVSRKKMDKIKADKIEEYKANMKARRGGGRN